MDGALKWTAIIEEQVTLKADGNFYGLVCNYVFEE